MSTDYEPRDWTVYFIQVDIADGPIKIGRTRGGKVLRRLDDLQTSSPFTLKVLATIDDVRRSFERELHRRFVAHHIRGEWFRPDPELLAFIRAEAVAWTTPQKFPMRSDRDRFLYMLDHVQRRDGTIF